MLIDFSLHPLHTQSQKFRLFVDPRNHVPKTPITTTIQEATCNTQGCKLQQNPITSAIQKCNKSCKTCTTLADLINIILCKHNIIHELATCSQSQISAMTSRQSVTCRHRNRAERQCYCCAQLESIEVKKNTVDNMEEFRQLTDREIKHFIELRRQQECLWKVIYTNKNQAYLQEDGDAKYQQANGRNRHR